MPGGTDHRVAVSQRGKATLLHILPGGVRSMKTTEYGDFEMFRRPLLISKKRFV